MYPAVRVNAMPRLNYGPTLRAEPMSAGEKALTAPVVQLPEKY